MPPHSYAAICMNGNSKTSLGNLSSRMITQNNRVFPTPTHDNIGTWASLVANVPTLVHEAPTITLPLVEESISEANLLYQIELVCMFNGFWPRLVNIHAWITKN